MSKSIFFESEVVSSMYQHAVQDFPYECCGFLYGKEDTEREISHAVPVINTKEGDQRRRFEISPFDYLKAEQYALKNNLQLLGVYHSHPNHPAIASQTDLDMALPYFSYAIVSVNEGFVADLKSWRLQEDVRQFEEETVEISASTFIH